MVQLVVFVNLFFVPTLPLYMMYRNKRKPLKLSAELLFQYCIVTACNIPMAKVFNVFAKIMGGASIPIDSGYYTLAALISAFLIPCLYGFIKLVRIEVEVRKNEANEETE